MEAVIDKLVSELNIFKDTLEIDGGCSDVLSIEAVYFGDPGLIPALLYPCFTVEAVRDDPSGETTGYEIRDLTVAVAVLVDMRSYFDASVDEASGDRALVKTLFNLRRWLRRTANRHLDGQVGVREVKIQQTEYIGEVRGSVIAKTGRITVEVNKQYPKVP